MHAADGGYTKEHVPGSATITLAMKDSAFVGYTPGCVTVTLSNHGVLDQVDAVPFLGAGPDGAAAAAAPAPGSATRVPPNPTIAFAHTDARLKPSKSGTVAIALKPFDRAVKGKLTVADTHGHTLGSKSYSAQPDKAVTVKVSLNAATRRALSQRPQREGQAHRDRAQRRRRR